MRQIWKQFRPYINATTTTKVVRHFSSRVNVANWKLDKSWYENSQKREETKLKVEALEDNLSNGSSVAIDQVNALVRECRENKCHYMVGRLYNIINSGRIHPDYTTMEELIYASIERKELKKAESLFDKLEKKYGLHQASNIFDAMIAGYFETDAYVEGWDMVKKMQCSHVPFSEKTYAIMLRHCTQKVDLQKYLNWMSQNCIKQTDEILEALITAYVRCGLYPDARKVVNENKSKPDLKNSLVTAYVDSNLIQMALFAYKDMKQDQRTPRAMTITKLLLNISHWNDRIYLNDLSSDLESMSRNYNEWAGGSTAICYFHIKYKMKQSLFIYMTKKLQYWPTIYVCEKREIFNWIFRRIQKVHPSSVFGLEVLQWSKNVLHFIPSRAAHEFLLYMAYQKAEWGILESLLAEYKTSGYEFNLLYYIFLFKARLTCSDWEGAQQILTEVAQAHNDGLFQDLYPGPTKYILNVFSKYYNYSLLP